MGKNRMIAKSCPKCEMQVAVASKSCKCGHAFFTTRKTADHILPEVEDIRRRTGRVRRAQPQFYDAQQYQKQKRKRESPKKRTLEEYKIKESKSESATARARRRRALRRAQRETQPHQGDRTRDPTPQLKPAQLARCSLILQEINRKITSVMWQPPA